MPPYSAEQNLVFLLIGTGFSLGKHHHEKRQAHESAGSRLRTSDFAAWGGVATVFSEQSGNPQFLYRFYFEIKQTVAMLSLLPFSF